MGQSTHFIHRKLNRRNIVISSLLFLVILVQLLILSPRDLEGPEDPLTQIEALRGKKGSATGKRQSKSPPQSVTLKSEEKSSSQIMNNVRLVEAKPEGKEWELAADRAVRPKGSDEWTVEFVKIRFFAKDGVIYDVKGRQGGVIQETSDIWIKGNVETVSSNGYTFRSDSLRYESKKKRLWSTEPVEMVGPKDKDLSVLMLTGDSMSADLNSNEMVVERNVRGRKEVLSGKKMQIQSHKALFSGRSRSAAFSGSVIIDYEATRITGPEARLGFNADQSALESVFVSGGVKVTDADRLATSGTLAVSFVEDRYVFEGSPRVVQKSDELVGDKIIFLNGGKKVQVVNAKAQFDPRTQENENQKPK